MHLPVTREIRRRQGLWLGVAFIVLATTAVYWPSLRGGFLLDDRDLITGSDLVRSSDGLTRIWFTTEPIDYWPVTNSSFWIEWRIWGSHALGYHLDNLVLHCANAILVWLCLRRLLIPGSYFAAVCFALHPVNVQSVAWIAERKNTLSLSFFLLSIIAYLAMRGTRVPSEESAAETEVGAAESTGQRSKLAKRDGFLYAVSLVCFMAALLSKGSTAVLPAILLLIQWWRHGRVDRGDIVKIAPFFALAIVFTGVNIWFQTHGGATNIRHVTPLTRILGAAAAVWFYLAKAIAPINLSFIYPQWKIAGRELVWWLPLVALIVFSGAILALGTSFWRSGRAASTTWRAMLFFWALYCVALVPVLGFVDVGFMKYSLVADHYQYIALVGVCAAGAALLFAVAKRFCLTTDSLALVCSVVCIILGGLTFEQSMLYASAERLYRATLAKNPDCWLLRNNLAAILNDTGRPAEALEQAREALHAEPHSPEALFNLAKARGQLGDLQGAIDGYTAAIEAGRRYPEAENNLGILLGKVGRRQEAISHLQIAVASKPKYADAENNLGNALVAIGSAQQAIAHYKLALEYDPYVPSARSNMAAALATLGRYREAIEQYDLALRASPQNSAILANMALTYAADNQPALAIATAKESIKLAREQHDEALANQVEQWLERYRP